MAAIPEVPKDTRIDSLLSELMPKIAQDMLKEDNASAELSGTVISMVIEAGDTAYTYIVKDGSSVECSKGNTDDAMLRLKILESDLKKMIETGNLDMLLGIQNDLNRVKYNTITSLKGSFVAEISDGDGLVVKIEAILNNTRDPKSLFRMSAADTSALMRKETNPVNLFMSGAMKIEGDMAFAMATQPLFS